MKRATLMLAVLALMLGGAGQARAAFTLTLDNPNPTIVIPSSGSIDYAFTGTLSFDSNNTVSSASLLFPFQGGSSPGLSGAIVNFPYSAANNGGTFVGTLFTIHIDSTSALGLYDQAFGGGPATFSVTEQDRGGESQTLSVAYTVTLTDGLDPVPAPPGVVLFGVGLVGLAGFRALRRKTGVAVA